MRLIGIHWKTKAPTLSRTLNFLLCAPLRTQCEKPELASQKLSWRSLRISIEGYCRGAKNIQTPRRVLSVSKNSSVSLSLWKFVTCSLHCFTSPLHVLTKNKQKREIFPVILLKFCWGRTPVSKGKSHLCLFIQKRQLILSLWSFLFMFVHLTVFLTRTERSCSSSFTLFIIDCGLLGGKPSGSWLQLPDVLSRIVHQLRFLQNLKCCSVAVVGFFFFLFYYALLKYLFLLRL